MRQWLVQYIVWFTAVTLTHSLLLWSYDLSPTTLYFWESYALNAGLTLAFLWGLLKAFDRLSHYVAWLFMAGSAVKFMLFFWLLWPLFQSDGTVDIFEKTTFLVPYGSSLILETRILIVKLNKI